MAEERSVKMPPLYLPLLWYALAAVCLTLACLGAVRYAKEFTGFYYSPHLLALTHLVTLGWVTANIMGSLYIVFPMSFQTTLPSGKIDHFFFWLYVVGLSGMVAHFWIGHYLGMAYSAGCVYLAILFVAHRVFRAAHGGKMGIAKHYIELAFINFLLAGGWGLTIALHKVYGFLPTGTAPNLYAHIHMAAIGWAGMVVFGTAYRLLPMFLPAKPVKGNGPRLAAALLETGVVGLSVCLLFSSRWALLFAPILLGGIGMFVRSAVFMASNRRPAPPPEIPRPDFSIAQAMSAFAWLFLACAAGVAVLVLKPGERTLQLTFAYGVAGIMGFLSQIVVGMKPKILSVFTWYFAFTRAGKIDGLPRPVDMPVRKLQIVSFAFWQIAIPCLVAGIMLQTPVPVASGAVSLLLALLVSTVHNFMILRLIWKN